MQVVNDPELDKVEHPKKKGLSRKTERLSIQIPSLGGSLPNVKERFLTKTKSSPASSRTINVKKPRRNHEAEPDVCNQPEITLTDFFRGSPTTLCYSSTV